MQTNCRRKTSLQFSVTLAAWALWLITGCARVSVTQERFDQFGNPERTKFKATTFFDSKNELAKTRTTQTEKTQGVTVSGLEQESSGTNATALLERAIGAAVSAAVKSVAP